MISYSWYFCTLICTPPLYTKDWETPSPSHIIQKIWLWSNTRIRNNVLSTLDFLHNANGVACRTIYHLTTQKPLYTLLLYGLPKIYTPFVSPCTKSSHTRIFYGLPKIHIPYLRLPHPFQPVIAICGNRTHQLSKYAIYATLLTSNSASATATSSYNSLNLSRVFLIIPTPPSAWSFMVFAHQFL